MGHLSDEEQRKLEEDVHRVVSDSLAEAESYGTVKDGPWSDPASIFDDVFATMTPQLLDQRKKAGF